MTTREVDAIVAGAGPAGLICALALAPARRVVIVDKGEARPDSGIDPLPSSAADGLVRAGLWDAFVAQKHAAAGPALAAWGGGDFLETESLGGPGGNWLVDRARFDAQLRDVALARGVEILSPGRLVEAQRSEDSWTVGVQAAGRRRVLRAPVLIDASGRDGALAHRLGGRRAAADHLISGWIAGRDTHVGELGRVHIAAHPAGWWRTMALPGGRRLVAYHTDANLAAARVARDRRLLLQALVQRSPLAMLLGRRGFVPDAQGGLLDVQSGALSPPAADGWLAVGDVALTMDPLLSRRLLTALDTGLAAADAAARHLAGEADAVTGYIAHVEALRADGFGAARGWYGRETRWADQPFWRRRQGGNAP